MPAEQTIRAVQVKHPNFEENVMSDLIFVLLSGTCHVFYRTKGLVYSIYVACC